MPDNHNENRGRFIFSNLGLKFSEIVEKNGSVATS